MIESGISLIIPAYNEGANIRRVVEEASAFLSRNFRRYEVIVVDDGSTDATVEALRTLPRAGLKILVNGTNQGKGFSVRRGVEAAELEYVLFSDADLSTPLAEVLGFFTQFNAGYDIVIGSRAVQGSRLAKRQGLLRRSMGKTFNRILQLLLFKGIRDTQCGFKCFKREQAQRIFRLQRIRRFCFDAEALFIASLWGLRIKEEGVEWRNRADSRVAIVADSLNMFCDLFRIRVNGWRGLYDQEKGNHRSGKPAVPAVRRDARPVPAQGAEKTVL